ncbi:MAG: growth inhibitor PemK [Caulobacter sp.]|nr:growth inhibitor PemK [Caulobacter sp.]
MALPDPTPGLVVSYAYLWEREARAGQEEGAKDRPCVIILSVQHSGGERIVHVAPVTHVQPRDLADAVPIPIATKRRLGLDDQPSWIVTSELNRFVWPGADLRPISRNQSNTFAYGSIPLGLLRLAIEQIRQRRRIRTVSRSDDLTG